MARLAGRLLNLIAPVRHNLILFVPGSGRFAQHGLGCTFDDKCSTACAAGPRHLCCFLRRCFHNRLDKTCLGHVLFPLNGLAELGLR